ncbi:hypothetical protein GCM10027430_33150 [Lysobacter tyrosinilyticus]
MELDDIKTAWQSLDRRLQRQNDLNLQLFRQDKLDRMQSGLRPLFWGQIVQILFGVLFVALAALLWMSQPEGAAVIAAGVVVHAYGVITIIAASVVLAQMRRIDPASPVLEIQKQLARVRTLYIRSGMVAGLPWWFMWVPVLMVLLGLGDVNLLAKSPGMVWSGLGVGALGLLATWWFHHWSRHPRRPRLAQAMENSVTGASLRRAKAQLDELVRFEHE